MYKTSFYTKPDGKSPIKEFLNKSNEVLRTKILRQIKYIQEFGLTHSNPNLKKISGTPVWEIRILGKEKDSSKRNCDSTTPLQRSKVEKLLDS